MLETLKAYSVRPKNGGTDGMHALVIPKIFHRIWLGPKPLPDYAVAYGAGWLANHPGWEMRLWTDHNLPPLVNQWAFDHAMNYGHKGDLLRMELLRFFGGVYLDTDLECNKNIEPLLDGVEAFAGYTEPADFSFKAHFEQAILGARPRHRLFKKAVLEQGEWGLRHERTGHIQQAAAWYLAHKIEEVYGESVNAIEPGRTQPLVFPDFTLFPKGYFYPFHWSEAGNPGVREGKYPDAFAVHRIRGSWLT